MYSVSVLVLHIWRAHACADMDIQLPAGTVTTPPTSGDFVPRLGFICKSRDIFGELSFLGIFYGILVVPGEYLGIFCKKCALFFTESKLNDEKKNIIKIQKELKSPYGNFHWLNIAYYFQMITDVAKYFLDRHSSSS